MEKVTEVLQVRPAASLPLQQSHLTVFLGTTMGREESKEQATVGPPFSARREDACW